MPVVPSVRYRMEFSPHDGRRPGGCRRLNGKVFRYYTEKFSGYTRGGAAMSGNGTQIAGSSPQPAEPGGEPPPRRRRADARRNIDALIEAAKTVFATSGVDAPAKEI